MTKKNDPPQQERVRDALAALPKPRRLELVQQHATAKALVDLQAGGFVLPDGLSATGSESVTALISAAEAAAQPSGAAGDNSPPASASVR